MSDSAPSSAAGVVTPVAPVLSAEQLRELEDARARWRKVQKAVQVSRVSAWLLAVSAGLVLLSGFASAQYALLGLMLAGITAVEFIGGNKLRRAEPRAALLLAWNQALLIGILGAYCFYKGFIEPPPPPSEFEQLFSSPEVQDGLRELGMQDLGTMASNTEPLRKLSYGVVALSVLLTQGAMVLYYFSRRRVVETYLRSTPAWVVEVQRRAA